MHTAITYLSFILFLTICPRTINGDNNVVCNDDAFVVNNNEYKCNKEGDLIGT